MIETATAPMKFPEVSVVRLSRGSTLSKIWILVLGIAIVVNVAGCVSKDAPTASTPTVDPQVAFAQYNKASRLLLCSPASLQMDEAAEKGTFGIMKSKAFEYRDVLVALDGQLGKIDFPAAVEPIVAKMRDLIADDESALNELGTYDGNDKDRLATLRNRVWLDESSWFVNDDHLRKALGHPVHPAGYAADLVESAQATFYTETAPVHAKWAAAMAAKDLAGAKAANDIEIDAAQRYIDKLDAIDWPPGSFEEQANILRGHLRGLIDFDRRQVDVASAEEIVEVPAEGVPDVQGIVDAKDNLWTALVKNYRAMDPDGQC